MTLPTAIPTARIHASCCPTCERPWQSATLPQKLIDELAIELPVSYYFAESNCVELRKDGDRLIGLCPFHPGAVLVIEQNGTRWSCSAGCPQGSTSVEWFMKTCRIDRHTAVERMLRSFFEFEQERRERRRSRQS